MVKTDVYQISWDAESALIGIDWQQPVTEATYRAGMTRVLERSQDHTARRLFSNAAKLEAGTNWDDNLTWVLEEWHPQFATTSVAAVAVVYPADSVGQYMTDKMGRAQVDRDIAFVCFNEPEVALRWLRDQPAS